MPKNYKFQILWSTKMTPEDIKKAVDDERINQLILKGMFRCRIGSLVKELMAGVPTVRDVVVAPSEPHGLISSRLPLLGCPEPKGLSRLQTLYPLSHQGSPFLGYKHFFFFPSAHLHHSYPSLGVY